MINEYGTVGSKYSKTTHPSAVLSTTNTTGPDLGSDPGHPDGKLATNCLSYGMVHRCAVVSCVKLRIISSDLKVCEKWGNIAVTHPGSELWL
jgi:hypothetical protein